MPAAPGDGAASAFLLWRDPSRADGRLLGPAAANYDDVADLAGAVRGGGGVATVDLDQPAAAWIASLKRR